MKKLIVALLCCASFSQAKGFDVDKARELTVLVQNVGQGMGSGVLIDNTHVLTCFHMAKGPKDDFLIFLYPMGKVVEARVDTINPKDDLMILTLSEPVPLTETPVFENHVMIGEPITVVGNALGVMTWFVSKGVVSAVRRGAILTDALVNPGNSGGPWFNESGDIVAITSWRIGPNDEHNTPGYAGGIPGYAVNAFLDQWGAMKDQEAMIKALRGIK